MSRNPNAEPPQPGQRPELPPTQPDDPAQPEPPPLPPDAPTPTAPVREPVAPAPAGDPPTAEPTRLAHAQTVAAALRRPRRRALRGEESLYESRLVEVEPGARVLLKCRWQEDRRRAPTLLLLHGLEGSSRSLYVLGTAQKAFRAGFNVVCMNMRNCGDTEHLSRTLYHSGMTGDIHRVVPEELAGREGLKEIY